MKYTAATWLEKAQMDVLDRRGGRRRLLSFGILAETKGERNQRLLERYMKNTDLELMLDSGAYSAWTRGTPIKLQDYIDFILKWKDAWTVVVNLDVIPGSPGRAPTPKQAEAAAQEGWENYVELQRQLKPHGITPIHVFHRGDDFKWLKRLVNECEFFGLAPKTDGTTEQRMEWLDRCMPYVTDDKGWPIRKLHGFAVTAIDLMERFPWWSVDSTSWIMMGRYGGAFIVAPNGKVEKIAFSSKSSKRKDFEKHVDDMPALELRVVAAYLQSIGIFDEKGGWQGSIKRLRDDYCLTCRTPFEGNGENLTCCSEAKANVAYITRDEVNIQFFLDFEKRTEIRPWRKDQAASGFTF